MKTIRISFINYGSYFDGYDNIFLFLLKKKYNVIIDNENPEYTFTGLYNSINKNSINIYVSGESHYDKGLCDFGLVQYFVDRPNYIRFPLYLSYTYEFIKRGVIKDFDFYLQPRIFKKEDLKNKYGFCTFIHSGTEYICDTYRDFFLRELMQYKKIDCPGTRYNNIPKLPGDSDNAFFASIFKKNFIKHYKFTFAFENTSTKDNYNGYTTEKIIEPFICNTIPLYWGNTLINNEFNNKSFINVHDFINDTKVIEKIIEIDNNDNLYIDMMNEPCTYKNDYLNIDYLISLLEKIIN